MTIGMLLRFHNLKSTRNTIWYWACFAFIYQFI